MSTYLTFTSKETYLSARTARKQRYLELCTEQRQRKAAISQGMKEGRFVYGLQWDAISHKSKAEEHLYVLSTMREKAQQQYLASKQ